MLTLALKTILCLTFVSPTLISTAALAADPTLPTIKKKSFRVKKRPTEVVRASAPHWSPTVVVNVPPSTDPKPVAPVAPTSLAPTVEPQKRILNIRLHPITLLEMATRQDTRAALRGDLDFVLSDKVTLGASVLYHQTSVQDMIALQNGVTQSVDLGILEVGLLSNIYLTGTTSAGGLILRPHVYWIEAQGEKNDGAGAITPSARTTQGGRAGTEMIYQVILSNGFNLELGGGFTYHLAPYTVDYSDGGLARSTPDNRLVPTVSAAIGWAF